MRRLKFWSARKSSQPSERAPSAEEMKPILPPKPQHVKEKLQEHKAALASNVNVSPTPTAQQDPKEANEERLLQALKAGRFMIKHGRLMLLSLRSI